MLQCVKLLKISYKYFGPYTILSRTAFVGHKSNSSCFSCLNIYRITHRSSRIRGRCTTTGDECIAYLLLDRRFELDGGKLLFWIVWWERRVEIGRIWSGFWREVTEFSRFFWCSTWASAISMVAQARAACDMVLHRWSTWGGWHSGNGWISSFQHEVIWWSRRPSTDSLSRSSDSTVPWRYY
jgi:hypothetical protein